VRSRSAFTGRVEKLDSEKIAFNEKSIQRIRNARSPHKIVQAAFEELIRTNDPFWVDFGYEGNNKKPVTVSTNTAFEGQYVLGGISETGNQNSYFESLRESSINFFKARNSWIRNRNPTANYPDSVEIDEGTLKRKPRTFHPNDLRTIVQNISRLYHLMGAYLPHRLTFQGGVKIQISLSPDSLQINSGNGIVLPERKGSNFSRNIADLLQAIR